MGREGRGLKPLKTGSSLVAVVYLGGDFLFELGELVLREGARQDLGTPFNEAVDHVTDRVEHLTFVPLSAETDEHAYRLDTQSHSRMKFTTSIWACV